MKNPKKIIINLITSNCPTPQFEVLSSCSIKSFPLCNYLGFRIISNTTSVSCFYGTVGGNEGSQQAVLGNTCQINSFNPIYREKMIYEHSICTVSGVKAAGVGVQHLPLVVRECTQGHMTVQHCFSSAGTTMKPMTKHSQCSLVKCTVKKCVVINSPLAECVVKNYCAKMV